VDYNNGGAMTIAGGASVAKNIHVGLGVDINGSYLTKTSDNVYTYLGLSNDENKYTGFTMFSSTGNSLSYPFRFSLFSFRNKKY
jgi:hypothetical protein